MAAKRSPAHGQELEPVLKAPLLTDADEDRQTRGVEVQAEYHRAEEDADQDGDANSTTSSGNDSSLGSVHSHDTVSMNSTLNDNQDISSVYSLNNDHHQKNKWKDAVLYVDEGEKDAKIFHHPEGYWSKRAYKTLHHHAYYVTHLIISILLLLLAVIETPLSLTGIHPIHQTNKLILSLHTAVEILLLCFFFADIILRFVWFGPKRFFTHIRTMFITIILIVMIIEAITVLIRQDSHFRLTRALRPIIFIDSHYLYGVRRVMRQIFLCIKPITDVLLLILFFIVFFSLLGYYFFSEVDPTFFSSFWRSFVSLFITMTTANNPDVMLEAYFEHPYSPLFFFAYLAITFYFLMNVLLAVVYGSFEEEEKKKFKKLFKHKLCALDKAYEKLAYAEPGIPFFDFLMFMRYYRPLTPEWQVMCIFKALHKNPQEEHQYLSKEEFRKFYDVRNLNWKVDKESEVISRFQYAVKIQRFFSVVVKSKAFNIIFNLIVLINLFLLIIYTIVTSGSSEDRYEKLQKILPASYLFICIYIVEIMLRIVGNGPFNYFRKPRNIADFVIILISFICLVLESEISTLIFLAAVRPFKLIRVLRLKRRFRDITTTSIALLPKLANIAVLLIVVYYFFAIIGIECLSGTVYKGCCNNSWYGVGSSYSGVYRENTTDNIPPTADVYYILNFNNILTSYVTLFVLMVVNNWYIIMEGFASEVKAGWLVRVYFISFFTVMLVILQVVISFIVDEFKFKVLDTAKERICPQHRKPFERCRCKQYRKKVVEVTLQPADVGVLAESITPQKRGRNLGYFVRKFRQIKLSQDTPMSFIGRRHNTKDDVKLKIYHAEITEWISEYEQTRAAKLQRGKKTRAEKKLIMKEKAKKFARDIFLYFIDLVIE